MWLSRDLHRTFTKYIGTFEIAWVPFPNQTAIETSNTTLRNLLQLFNRFISQTTETLHPCTTSSSGGGKVPFYLLQVLWAPANNHIFQSRVGSTRPPLAVSINLPAIDSVFEFFAPEFFCTFTIIQNSPFHLVLYFFPIFSPFAHCASSLDVCNCLNLEFRISSLLQRRCLSSSCGLIK